MFFPRLFFRFKRGQTPGSDPFCFLFACVLGATLVFAPVGLAADEREVQFQVDGLSCPFCVFGLKKKLGEVEGLKGVEVDYKKGLVRARWDDAKPFNEDAIKKAVQDAGFTPGEISSPA